MRLKGFFCSTIYNKMCNFNYCTGFNHHWEEKEVRRDPGLYCMTRDTVICFTHEWEYRYSSNQICTNVTTEKKKKKKKKKAIRRKKTNLHEQTTFQHQKANYRGIDFLGTMGYNGTFNILRGKRISNNLGWLQVRLAMFSTLVAMPSVLVVYRIRMVLFWQ